MLKPTISSTIPLLLLANTVWADCLHRSFTACDDRIVHWFDPSNGEVCDLLDCGGGRAPVKTDVPGCPAYKGTEVYVSTKSTLSCWTPSASLASTSATVTSTGHTTDTASVKGTDNGPASSTTASVASSTQPSAERAAAPATTEPPSRSTGAQKSGNASSTIDGGAQETTTDTNGSSAMGGSLIAVAGAVVGVIALV
ncbi:hypothetical protein HFD88_010379 [Aspergillus terreus]|nr:hypothetical protein HFD88_010379 [Aspergillus terreus]